MVLAILMADTNIDTAPKKKNISCNVFEASIVGLKIAVSSQIENPAL